MKTSTIISILSVLLILGSPVFTNAQSQYYGNFVGQVRTEWVDGRNMRLLETFRYVDPAGGEWNAPAGSMVDGASIPKFAWSIIGGPFEGTYRYASVIHDVACAEKKRPWENVHLMFYNAMRAAKVESTKARIMYAAVYHFGPRWVQVIAADPTNIEALVKNIKNASDSDSRVEPKVEKKYGCPPRLSCSAPAMYDDTTIVVTPSASRLNPQDFSNLQSLIETRAKSNEEFSLEEIRNYGRRR